MSPKTVLPGQAHIVNIYFYFFWGGGATALRGQGPLIHEVSRSQKDSSQSVGLPWTSDRLIAETSTWQHTTLTTDMPRWDSNPQS